MKEEVVSTGYEPRPLQNELHRSVKRFNVIVCHRRFGKTVWAINHMIDAAFRLADPKNPNRRPNPRYAYLAPLYSQAKRVAWDYLKEYTLKIPGAVANEADLRVDIPDAGIRFSLLGADNPVSLKGIYLDGVVLDEYAEMNPAAWGEVIRPTLSDREGWAIFIGTPKGQNSFYEMHKRTKPGTEDYNPDWYGKVFKASETGILPQAELDSAKADMEPEEYEQEFECSFMAALVGAYYGDEIAKAEAEGRICSVPYDQEAEVDTYWDLGMNDTTAIWFIQQVGKEIHCIDYLEDSGVGLPEWHKRLKDKPYNYGRHVFPHDLAARELGTGVSREETLRSLGFRNIKKVPKQSPLDGIHAVRMLFNRIWFDEGKCDRGLDSLKNYQRKWDSKNNIFSSMPLHNWASNGADAFRTFALGIEEDDEDSRRRLPREAESHWNPLD